MKIELEKKTCAYPGCTKYKKGLRHYCCNGCRFDHTDAKRLKVRFSQKKLK